MIGSLRQGKIDDSIIPTEESGHTGLLEWRYRRDHASRGRVH